MATDLTGDASGTDDFAHLHLHSQYSLLDGAIRTKDLCKRVKERGMKSVAVTDHGNMFGALQFYQEAKDAGVKPIFGCEAYVAEGDATARTDRRNFHLVLLAKNEVGFRNLQRLVSFGHLKGFYYNPRIDRAILRQHSEGLIGLSACLGGHVSRMISAGDRDAARAVAAEYREIFAPGHYFLELQANGMEQQELVNAALAQLGRDLDIPLVATNDCHYVDRKEAFAHEVLMCMGMGRTFDDKNRLKHACDEFFIKRPDEMWSYFSRYPEAYANAGRIAAMCNVDLKVGKPELPDFTLPAGIEDDLPGYLRRVAHAGLDARIAEMRARGLTPSVEAYRARLEFELQIIIDMQFPGYFLIVWDFIRHAKEIGVPVGPGRGSGAGSLVAYAMRITDLDPIQYNLLFERFLNPERVSMPDFDIDFCMDRRDEVIRYVTDRYGADRVGQIATFHSLKARGLVRDVCRVMNVPLSEANELASAVPEGPKVALSMAMKDADELEARMKADPELAKSLGDTLEVSRAATKLRTKVKDNPRWAQVLEIGVALEGLNRHAGTHAAGIVIGNRELWEHVPCFQAEGKIVTQYTMTDVEKAGLVKFDFLGLKTLTVIATAVRLIDGIREGTSSAPFDLGAIAMDDAGVYQMISRGDTTGVFQLESSGFKDLLKRLKPDCFEDIIAAVALYRPGPLEGGMVDQFIDCKHGRRAIEYPHPLLAEVLRETYGVFVYQEQVMQAAQILAGFSLGAADLMRRAMGKKKKSEMDAQRALFVEGCGRTNAISESKANEIFDLIDKFAGYGFNKSHSAAYGLITYQTAFLKHHHPVAFMAALMSCDKDKIENVVKFIGEARAMGITVLSPDVDESQADFRVVVRDPKRPPCAGQAIRFGLGAVRGVGEGAVQAILEARAEGGAFASLWDFCRRVDLKRVNKRVLESLVAAGAFDGLRGPGGRAQLMALLDEAVEQGQSAQRDKSSGQFSLFDMMAAPEVAFEERWPAVEEWALREKLTRERDAIGFYLTGHPLDRYQQDIARHATLRIADFDPKHAGREKEVRVGGIMTEFREVQTKSGKGPMAMFKLEDQFGRVEAIAFPKTYAKVVDEPTGETLGERMVRVGDQPVFIKGKLEVQKDDEGRVTGYKLMVDDVTPISQVREERTTGVRVTVTTTQLDDGHLLALKVLVANHGGPCRMELRVVDPGRFATEIVFGDEFRVAVGDGFIHALERLFGARCAELV
jgi:DNA polymerase-3 subunit alpha